MRQVRDATAAILDRTSLADAVAKPRAASLIQLEEPA
jgi:DNA-binding IscR family transcriptional regulator